VYSKNLGLKSLKLFTVAVLLAASIAAFAKAPSPPKKSHPPRAPTKVILEVRSVECNNETGWIKRGGDEIALGGVVIDPSHEVIVAPAWRGYFAGAGKVRKTKKDKMPHVLATLSLPSAKNFPTAYQATLVLAELDQGNKFEKYVAEVAAKGGQIAKKAQAKRGLDKTAQDVVMAGAMKAVSRGQVSPEGVLAGTAEEVGDRALEMAKKEAKKAWEDDIFQPQAATFVLKSPDFRFEKGSMVSKPQTATFKGFKGRYTVTYVWRLAL
jgi:hypothetical protein